MNATSKFIIAAAMAASVSAYAFTPQMLPRQEDCVNVHPSSLLMPDTASNARWDFSNAEALAPDAQFRYRHFGDSLYSEIRPGMRLDYILSGDSLMFVRAEGHAWRVDVNGHGAPHSLPADNASLQVLETGRQYMCDSMRGNGSASMRLVTSGTLILPGSVVIPDVNLIERTIVTTRFTPDYYTHGPVDSLTWLHSEIVYSWEHPKLRYPLAETRFVSDSLLMKQLASHSWQSFYSLPSDQPIEIDTENIIAVNNMLMGNSPIGNYALSDENGDYDMAGNQSAFNGELSVNPSGNNGNILLSGKTYGNEDEVEFLLCDVAGRVYATSGKHSYTAGQAFSHSFDISLPPGTYLINARHSTGNSTVKFRID